MIIESYNDILPGARIAELFCTNFLTLSIIYGVKNNDEIIYNLGESCDIINLTEKNIPENLYVSKKPYYSQTLDSVEYIDYKIKIICSDTLGFEIWSRSEDVIRFVFKSLLKNEDINRNKLKEELPELFV